MAEWSTALVRLPCRRSSAEVDGRGRSGEAEHGALSDQRRQPVRHILGQTILRALAQSSVALCVVWVLSAATRTRTDLILSSLRVACAAFAVRWIAIGMPADLSGNPAIARGCYSHAL